MPEAEQNEEHKSYPVEFSEYFDSIIRKLKKKDASLALRVLVFSFENGVVRMENFAHHDDAY